MTNTMLSHFEFVILFTGHKKYSEIGRTLTVVHGFWNTMTLPESVLNSVALFEDWIFYLHIIEQGLKY